MLVLRSDLPMKALLCHVILKGAFKTKTASSMSPKLSEVKRLFLFVHKLKCQTLEAHIQHLLYSE